MSKVLSTIFFGVFVAPWVTIIWFIVPWLRNFPVGDDSPHAIGLPVGFLIGVAVARALGRRFRWGRAAAIIGGIFLAASILCSFAAVTQMLNTPGWEGFGWLAASLLCLHAVLSALGLLLSGFFSLLAHKVRASVSPEVEITGDRGDCGCGRG